MYYFISFIFPGIVLLLAQHYFLHINRQLGACQVFQQLLRSCLCTSKYRIQELKRFYKWAAAASRKQANRSRGISAKKAKGAQSARQPSVPSRPACLLRPLQTVVSLDGQSQSAMSVMTWQQKRDSVPNQATTLTPATPRILVLQHSSAFCLYWLSVGPRSSSPHPPRFPQYSSNQSCGLNWGICLRRYIFWNFRSSLIRMCVCVWVWMRVSRVWISVCGPVTWPASRLWDFLRFCLRLRVEAASRRKFKVHIWWLLIEYLI